MGKSNVAIRQWLSQKEWFSNFVNGALFQGVPIFKTEIWKRKMDNKVLL